LAELLLGDLRGKKGIDIEKISHIDMITKRFVNYCRKMLHGGIGLSSSQIRSHSHLLTDLHIISSFWLYLAKYAYAHNVKQVTPSVYAYFEDVIKRYNDMYSLFLQRDSKKLMPFVDSGEQIQKRGYQLLVAAKGHETVIVYFLLSIVRKTMEQGGRLMVIIKGL